MKAPEEEDFQKFDAETVNQLTLKDCLDLFRKLQFSGLTSSKAHRHLAKLLEQRIINLVMPQGGALANPQNNNGQNGLEKAPGT